MAFNCRLGLSIGYIRHFLGVLRNTNNTEYHILNIETTKGDGKRVLTERSFYRL